MSVLTQVHLSRLQVINARSQYDRADAIYDADTKIAEVMRNRQMVQAQSKLDTVSTETAAILSLLRRYQALAQVHAIELGAVPVGVMSGGELQRVRDLEVIVGDLKRAGSWVFNGGLHEPSTATVLRLDNGVEISCVQVAGLIEDEALVEIQATAVVPD